MNEDHRTPTAATAPAPAAMACPRCGDAALQEQDRDGVTVDRCPRCRGLWLDRGELEKLIARATRELDEVERDARAGAPAGPGARYHDDDDDDRRRGPRRRRGWFESLADLID